MKCKQIWKTVASCLLAALLFPGCSDEEGGGTVDPTGGYATLVVSLQSVNSSEPVGTRAVEDLVFENEENNYERQISDWWVLIYNEEGTFVDYLSNRKNSPSTYPSGDDSEFSTSIELPIGTYHLYGFANLNSLDDATTLLTSLEGGSIGESDLVADRETKDGQAVNLDNVLTKFNVTENKPAIPMSSYSETVNLSENGNNEVSLGLYRMIGKVSISITNQTGEPIDVDGLGMRKFRTAGNIFLMPYNGLNQVGQDIQMSESMQPVFPKEGGTVTYADYTYTLNEGEQIANQETETYSFYVPETPFEGQENNGASPMIISFNIPQKGVPTERETNFDFVRRNDWLKIPITVSTIESTLKCSTQNMPIGGLPEILTQSQDGISIDIPCQVYVSNTGWAEIEYEVTTIANYPTTNIALKYPEGTVIAGASYCNATLTENIKEGNTYGLVINPETGESMANNSSITMTPDATQPGTKGKITIYTQELADDATATINLHLVAVCTNTDGSTTEVEIPYTIIVQNYEVDGGN